MCWFRSRVADQAGSLLTELSRRQCEALLRRLARTQFPFQCAHGRPTLLPVVNLPARTGSDGRKVEGGGRSLDWGALVEGDGEGPSVASQADTGGG